MFDELSKYKNQGHFFFQVDNSLAEQSKNVPDLPGVYYILKLAQGHVELVYIGKSGSVNQDGSFKAQTLRNRINNKQNGSRRQGFFERKIREEGIDGLDIYWFVTWNEDHQDLPAYVEGVIMQNFFDVQGCLPAWNKSF